MQVVQMLKHYDVRWIRSLTAAGQKVVSVGLIAAFATWCSPLLAGDVASVDVDGDGDVDLIDHSIFLECHLGVDVPYPFPECSVFDVDIDGDVDFRDWGRLQLGFTGSLDLIVATIPLDPNTASSGFYFSVGNDLSGDAQQSGFDPVNFDVSWTVETQPVGSGDIVVFDSDLLYSPFIIRSPASPGTYIFQLQVINNETQETAVDTVSLVLTEPVDLCGNGVLDDGEQCDDGNTTSGDGCNAFCLTENPGAPPAFLQVPQDQGMVTGERISEASVVTVGGAVVIDNDPISTNPLNYAWTLAVPAGCDPDFFDAEILQPLLDSLDSFGSTLSGQATPEGDIPDLTFEAPGPINAVVDGDDFLEMFTLQLHVWDSDNCPQCAPDNLLEGSVVQTSVQIGVRRSQFYVSTQGDDENFGGQRRCDGTASGRIDEWFTLQYAHDQVKPGDTVHIKAGTYTGDAPAEGTPILEIIRSGEPGLPITFTAFQQPDGRYDNVVLDGQFLHLRCIWIHACSYVDITAITVTRAIREGMLLGVGGTGFNSFVDPVNNINVRDCIATNCSLPNTWFGGFGIRAGSSDILFDRCEASNCGQGFLAGVPHHLIKSEQPRRITFRDCLARDNRRHDENSDGFTLAGAHECLLQRCVATGNVDDGFNSQGPHCDDNIFEYCVAYDQDPENTVDGDGNGFKLNNINNGIMMNGFSGGRDGIVRYCISYDNRSRGFDDTDGSHACSYYNNISYRNESWGFLMDSNAGQAGSGVTMGATLINNIGYANRDFYAGGGGDTDIALAFTQNPVQFSDYNFVGDGRFPGVQDGSPDWDQSSIGGSVTSPISPQFTGLNPVCDINLWIGDPAFRIPNPNFARVTGLELLSDSLCIDAGTDVGQLFDPIDGDGDGTSEFDMGPFEFSP